MIVANIQSTLDPAGPQAAHIEQLWWIFFWTCAVVYVVVLAFFFLAIARSRRNLTAEVTESTENSLRIGVGAATAMSVLVLIALVAISASAGARIGRFGSRDPRHIDIEVTGHQWWWEVKYPDSRIVDANVIHIPVETKVLLWLDTRDVIHSLWIPNLHGKRDLIPGRINKIWIQADSPGVYRGQCAEYCGLQHAHMALMVVAQSPEDFARWKAQVSSSAPVPRTPQQAHGQQVFLGGPCVNCHRIAGIEAHGTLGPDLTHFRSRPTIAAGTLLNTRGNVAGWVANAPAIKPGAQMPPNLLTGSDLNDLLAYLDTLR